MDRFEIFGEIKENMPAHSVLSVTQFLQVPVKIMPC